jgi:hypothetical protein
MRTSFHHQSEAQPPNGPLTAATSPDTPSLSPINHGRQDSNIRITALAEAAFFHGLAGPHFCSVTGALRRFAAT